MLLDGICELGKYLFRKRFVEHEDDPIFLVQDNAQASVEQTLGYALQIRIRWEPDCPV